MTHNETGNKIFLNPSVGVDENRVPTAIYYPVPLHLQAAFSDSNYKNGDFPIAEECASRIFSIPMHPYLNETYGLYTGGPLTIVLFEFFQALNNET